MPYDISSYPSTTGQISGFMFDDYVLQSLVLLVSSRSSPFVSFYRATLIPKIRVEFAEFLQDHFLERLGWFIVTDSPELVSSTVKEKAFFPKEFFIPLRSDGRCFLRNAFSTHQVGYWSLLLETTFSGLKNIVQKPWTFGDFVSYKILRYSY